jgi:predicted peptidase
MNKWMSISSAAAVSIGLMACSTTQTLERTNAKAASQTPSNTVAQSTWDQSYGGVDKSYDTQLLKMRAELAPKFQTLSFTDAATGNTMDYNLFVPKNYDEHKKYPLVLFMGDASTTGKGALSPLMQGYGGIVWASDASQARHPSFVLVPAFKGDKNAKGMNAVVNDQWQASSEVETALNLLHRVVGQYSIDENRLYTTGQSMGGMVSFYLNANHPDLFAASMFVSSQWDIKVLEPLAKMKFFYIVSAGDEKASGGMKQVGDMLTQKGVAFGQTKFSARLPQAEQNQYVQNLIKQNHNINFVQFDAGSVLPKNTVSDQRGGGDHMYSFDYAYLLSDARDWLFEQSKGPSNNTSHALARYQFEVGLNLFNGTGIAQDYAKAARLFEQATQMGDMKAPRYLGIMNEKGLGVKINYTQALVYYNIAANAGDITAAAQIGWLYERGLGVKQSYAEALKWYQKAAPSFDVAASNIHPRVLAVSRLGYLYEHGLGVKQDIAQAKIWYELAATNHDTDAINALARLNP